MGFKFLASAKNIIIIKIIILGSLTLIVNVIDEPDIVTGEHYQ